MKKTIKKQLAIALTAALLALPLGTTVTLADTVPPAETTSINEEADATNETGADTDATTTDTTSDAQTSNPDISDTDVASNAAEDNEAEAEADADAEDEETSVVDSEGNKVEPADWLSDLIEKLQMALTSDPVRKCELSEKYALAKLAKAHKLMTEGKTEECQIAFGEYTNKITKAQEYLDQVAIPDSEEAKTLTIALTNVSQNNIEVLGNLLDKLPEQAAQKLALNLVRTMEKAVVKLEKQEEKAASVNEPAEEPVVEAVTEPAAEPVTESVATPVVKPVTTAPKTDSKKLTAAEYKALNKQAREALKEFKESLKQKRKFDFEKSKDKDREKKENKNAVVSKTPSMSNTQPTSVTIAPAKVQPTSNTSQWSKQSKGDWNKPDENKKYKAKDKKQHDHQYKKDNKREIR